MTPELARRLAVWLLMPLTILAFCAAVSGCALTNLEIVRDLPPAALLRDCPLKSEGALTNGDLAQAIVACNADKAALREWAAEPLDRAQRGDRTPGKGNVAK